MANKWMKNAVFHLQRPASHRRCFRVRKLIQDSQRFMFHAKRSRLLGEDLDLALRVEGQEPIYGATVGPEFIPFRYE